MKYQYCDNEATVKYTQTIILCKNGYIKGREYKKSLVRIKDGFECSNPEITLPKKKKENDENKFLLANLTRTRNTLIEYVSENANDLHSFITLTFAENITDINEANKMFHAFIVMCRRKYPNFKYIGVPEYQKRGAVHFHILTNLVCGIDIPKREIKKTYNKEKGKYFEMEYYDIPYWNHGYSTAFDIDMADSNFNIALYLTKYLYKDIDQRLWGHKKILKSNNLRSPKKYFIEDNKIYKDAMTWIKEKGYQMTEFEFEPQEPYQIPFKQMTAFISHSDCNIVSEMLTNVYKE